MSRVYTDLAVFLIEPDGVYVREAFGVSFEQLCDLVPIRLERAQTASGGIIEQR